MVVTYCDRHRALTPPTDVIANFKIVAISSGVMDKRYDACTPCARAVVDYMEGKVNVVPIP